MKPNALLNRMRTGSFNNVSFSDAIALLKALGFAHLRTEGSHHIYGYPGMRELVDLQSLHGEAKPYQLKQMMKLVRRYGLELKRPR